VPPHGRPQNFFQGHKRRFACPLQAAEDVKQIDVHKTLYLFCAKKKISIVTATVANSVPSKKITLSKCLV